MPENVVIWREYALPAAIILLAVFFLSFAVLSLKRSRQMREELQRLQQQSDETVLEYTEQALRDMENRLMSSQGRDALSLQTLLQENQRGEMGRMDALGQRIDASLAAQENRLSGISRVLGERLTANDEKVERMRDTLYKGITSMQQENAQKLDEMRKTVDENLHQTLNKRLGESFSLVNERLEQVYKGLGEMKSLATGVGDLKRVLTNVKTRGVWGEMQLATLLHDTLAPGQYSQNVAVRPGTQERVEFAIRLPGQTEDQALFLPVDAKFPIEAYIRVQDAAETGEKAALDAARSELSSAIVQEAKRIAGKYIAPPYTTDFAVLYLPLEGLYAEVLQLGGVAERVQREYHIIISGPSTFSALLNSLQMGFRTLAIEQRSGEVWQLLGAVKAEFGTFGDLLDKTQQKLRQASDSIESATRKTRTIERRLRAVENIEDAADQPLLVDLEDEPS